MDEQGLTDYDYLLGILALLDFEEREWDRVRDVETAFQIKAKEAMTEYFGKLFGKGVPSSVLSKNNILFRARQIKQPDVPKLGVDSSAVEKTITKALLSEDDIARLERVNETKGFYLTPWDMAAVRALQNGACTKERKKRAESLMEQLCNPGVYGFTEKDSRVPPIDKRKEGRLNTVSDPYLYLSVDRDTAINEMRPSIGQLYSIAQFEVNTPCELVDLSGNYLNSSNANYGLGVIARKVSEPNTDESPMFYHITQHMAHILQDKGYDGIKYQSALNLNRTNIVLFNEGKVDFVLSEIVQITGVSVNFDTVLPFSKKDDV